METTLTDTTSLSPTHSAMDSSIAPLLPGLNDQCQAVVAVESEGVSVMDFTDDLPQLSRLQHHAQAPAQAGVEHLANIAEMALDFRTAAQPAAAAMEGVRQTHIEQRQPQQERGEQREQCVVDNAVSATAHDSASSSVNPSRQLPPFVPPPPALSHPPPADAPAAASHASTPEPCAYVLPLISHLDAYRASHDARVQRYQEELQEFNRVAVAPWVMAATRHLKRQEEDKREMTDKSQRINSEIAEFAAKMKQWQGPSTVRLWSKRSMQ